MDVKNISLLCCPKPKSHFCGANITPKAMQAIEKRIANNPEELDDFKAINKLDINIDLDKSYPSKVEFLVIERQDDANHHFATVITSMGKLRKNIEKIFYNR